MILLIISIIIILPIVISLIILIREPIDYVENENDLINKIALIEQRVDTLEKIIKNG
jgi:hypothetical protein